MDTISITVSGFKEIINTYITNYSSPPNSPLNLTGPIEIISFIEPNPEISLPLYEFFS